MNLIDYLRFLMILNGIERKRYELDNFCVDSVRIGVFSIGNIVICAEMVSKSSCRVKFVADGACL